MPCSTSSTAWPWTKRRRMPLSVSTAAPLLIAQRLHRIEPGRPPGRIDRWRGTTGSGPWRPRSARRPGSTLAGSCERKRISADHSSAPSRLSRPRRIVSMLSAKARPSRKPSRVPTTPIEAPLRRKTRRIAPRVAPIVRMIAMSRPLLFTSMVMPVMMLKAATRMIRVRIRNITLRSTWSAAKKWELSCCQSTSRSVGPPAAAGCSAR